MSESLQAACGQFEQVVLEQMLRTAGIGKAVDGNVDRDDGDGGVFETDDGSSSSASVFAQIVVQALSGAIERAGGIGLRRSLASALEKDQP